MVKVLICYVSTISVIFGYDNSRILLVLVLVEYFTSFRMSISATLLTSFRSGGSRLSRSSEATLVRAAPTLLFSNGKLWFALTRSLFSLASANPRTRMAARLTVLWSEFRWSARDTNACVSVCSRLDWSGRSSCCTESTFALTSVVS